MHVNCFMVVVRCSHICEMGVKGRVILLQKERERKTHRPPDFKSRGKAAASGSIVGMSMIAMFMVIMSKPPSL